ncbi:unnamed protein product [Peronospora belbahrii]|uniref:C2H2-type domain-containing protein n=1 Tax=Peronospora belbahrii TaxID=622444 RepID=A0AAU9KR65_9STRA|nr:unnamed protein product [Peronospora belbahrii]
MRLHFPDGKNVFRCIGRINCNWSCDNYKEFAQHQKLYHHILVGAQQQEQLDTRQDEHEHGHGIPTIEGSTEKDTEYFSTVDTTRNYSMDCLSYGNDHVAASNFLYPSSFDKSKSSVLPVRNKRTMGPSVFLGSTDLSSCLPTGILSKDHGPDKRRMRPSITAFPPVQYANSGSSLLNCSDSGVNRATFTTSNHFAPFRRQERRDDSSYEQYSSQQHQTLPFSSHHVLRPPPQRNDDVKYNGFTVATPEFTGEELSVVLQLMNETY